jgi:hypothetical protein
MKKTGSFHPCEICKTPVYSQPSRRSENRGRFCSRSCHYEWMRRKQLVSAKDRFWAKVKKTQTCWLWIGAKTSAGYGMFNPAGRDQAELIYAHRFAMKLTGIDIDGREGHHVCPNKNCIRIHPKHVVDVPSQHNPDSPSHLNRLKTHCKRGHLLKGQNLIPWHSTKGHRACRTCQNAAKRERRKHMTEKQRERERQSHRDYLKANPEQYQKLLAYMKKQKRWLLPKVRARHTQRARERRQERATISGPGDKSLAKPAL